MRKIFLLLLLIPSVCFGDSESTIGGKTAQAHIVQDEGTSLRPRPYLNFTGAGVTCSDSGGKTVCNMTGGGGSGGGSAVAVKVNGSTVSASIDTLTFTSDFTGTESPSGTANIVSNTWTRTSPYLYPKNITDNVGIGTTIPQGALVVMSGNVGIGTWKPAVALDIRSGGAKPLTVNLTGAVTGQIASFGNVTTGEYGRFDISSSSTGPFQILGSTGHDLQLGGGISGTTTFTSANVGIGSASPGTKLDVNGELRIISTNPIYFGTDKKAYIQGSAATNGDMNFATNSAEAMRISNGGNLGIGSVAPGTKLDVQGTTRTTGFQLSTNPSASYVLTSDSVGVGTWMPAAAGGGGSGTINSGTTNRAARYTGATTLDSSTLIFDDATNVGIGTIAPLAPVELGVRALDITSGNNVGIGTWIVSRGRMELRQSAQTASDGFAITSSTGGASTRMWIDNNSVSHWYAGATGTQTMAFNAGGGNVGIGTDMTSASGKLIVIGGNVGIGTITPGTALDVQGTVRATTFSGAGTSLTGTAASLTAGTVTTNANLTGPITSVGNATAIASQTGTGTKFVVDTTPTLVTPVLGVATATSINKVALTAPASSATLTIADGKTLTVTNTANINTLTDGKYCKYTASGTVIDCNYTCADITGSASLCDGSDDGAGGTSQWQLTNVGIGTIDPVGIGTYTYGSKLTVMGNVGIGTNGSSNYVTLVAPSGGLMVEGNVGIGTWIPTQKLQVVGTARATTLTDGTASLTGGSLTAVKLGTLTSNGFVKTGSGDGSLSVDTATYSTAVGANPTATVGTSAVNGSSANFMRADGAPAIDQAMTPTWTGLHTFNKTPAAIVTASGGNVGVGTANPGTALDVNGAVRTTGGSAASPSYVTTTGGNTTGAWAPAANTWAWSTNAVERARVDSSGNLGLGTVTPKSSLAILGSTGGVGIGTVANSEYLTNTAPAGGLIAQGNVGIGTWVPGAKFQVGGTGNVGIGSTLPFTNLDVIGNQRVSGNVGIGTTLLTTAALTVMDGNVGIGTWKPAAPLEIRGTTVGSVKAGANTACTTTCGTSSCLFGEDTSVVGTVVACSDATADICVCLGP